MAERGKLLHPENLDFEVGQEVEWGQKGQMGELGSNRVEKTDG